MKDESFSIFHFSYFSFVIICHLEAARKKAPTGKIQEIWWRVIFEIQRFKYV
jgi:hypothetical protein